MTPAGLVVAAGDSLLQDAGAGTAAGLWAARLANYAAFTAVVGLMVTAVAFLPGPARLGALARRATMAAAWAAGIWATTSAALFLLGMSNAAARPLPEALEAALAGRFAATRFGSALLVQLVVALAVAGLAAGARTRAGGWTALATAAAGGLATAWWGHAGTDELVAVAVPNAWAHILAAAVWVGGLAVLVLLVARRGPGDLATPARRFSRAAGWALAVVGLTGLVNAALHLTAVGQLTNTSWGRMVLVKVALFACLAALGLRQRRRVLPRLAAARDTATARQAFRTLAITEVGLMLVTFGVATTMASGVPADVEAAARIQTVVADFADGEINLTVDPAQTGSNVVHLYFLGPDGRQREVADPSLALAAEGARLDAALLPAGPGHYTVLGQQISAPGAYEVTVAATVDGEPTVATGTVTIR